MRGYVALATERIRAAPGMLVGATIAATVSTLVVTAGLAGSVARSDEPYLQMVHVSRTTPVSAGGTYSDVRVAVGNAGTATFDLSPHGSHVATVSVYLPNVSGEALVGGGVRAPVSFRVECENAAESSDVSKVVVVPFPVPGSEAP